MRKYSPRIFAAVAAAGLMASLGACQVKPGEYVIYRISNYPGVETPDCPGDPDIRDSSTFYGSGSFVVWASDPDTYHLEVDLGNGAVLLEGTRDGGDYTFLGDSVQVEGDTTVITNVVDVDVNFTIKGYGVTGKVTTFTSTTCSGDCMGFEPQSCTRTNEFVGTEVKDAELEHPI